MKKLTPSIQNWRTLLKSRGHPIALEDSSLSMAIYNVKKQGTGDKPLDIQEKPALYTLTLSSIDGVVIPETFKNKVAKADEVKPEPEFLYFVQPSVVMFSPKRGFFGTTWTGSKLELDGQTLKPKPNEALQWALMHTRLIDTDVKAIVEYTLIIYKVRRPVVETKPEESKGFQIKLESAIASEYKVVVATLQIGVAELPLFGSKQTSADLFRISPRLLLSGQSIKDGEKTTSKLTYSFK
jgi:hypothetical protein